MSIYALMSTKSIRKENKYSLFILGTIISYKYIE